MRSYNYDTTLNAALEALQSQNMAEAARLAALATEQRPDDAECWSILGLALGGGEGVAHLQKATQMEPQQPRWALHLGQGLSNVGDDQGAEAAFARAAQLSRGHPHIMEVWGDCLLRLERFREASNVFKQVLQAMPSSQVWMKAGNALIGANDTINAVKAYELAHTSENRPIEMSAKLAELHLLLNQYETAETFIHETLKAQPNDPDSGLRLANLHRWRGDHDKALEVQKRFWGLNPGHAGLIAALLDDRDESVLGKAISAASDLNQNLQNRRRINFALARFFDRQKKEKDAWTYAEKANGLYDDGVTYDDASEHYKQLEQALRGFSRLPAPTPAQQKMIYVAGPPRCGGSLLQTILSHSEGVVSVGERGSLLSWVLPKLGDFDALAELIPQLSGPDLAGMRKAAGQANFYVDKTSPHIAVLGILAKIHNGAQFVIPSRDNADMCVSMYFHDFPEEFAYTRTIKGIQAYLAFQDKASQAWSDAGLKIIKHDHDAFVQNPIECGQSLFRALGLPWSDTVLETGNSNSVVRTFSARQVRGGVSQKYRGRGERYAAYLKSG